MTESRGDSIFNLLRSCQAVSHSGRPVFQSHQQRTKVLMSLANARSCPLFGSCHRGAGDTASLYD